jgi:hypothetical protein
MRANGVLPLLVAGASGCLDWNSLDTGGGSVQDMGTQPKDMAMSVHNTDTDMTVRQDMTALQDMALQPFSLFPQRFMGVPLNGISGFTTGSKGGDVIVAVGNKGTVITGNGQTNGFGPAQNGTGMPNLTSVWVANATTAYVADTMGAVWSSNNLGNTAWVNQNAGAAHGLNAIIGRNTSDILAMGTDTNLGVYYNGTTWANAPQNSNQAMNGIWPSATTWYVVGAGGVLATAMNPTGTWNSMKISGAGNPPLNAIWGTDDKDVWAVGNGGVIVQYNGTTWTPSTQGSTNFNAIWGSSVNNILAVGNNGTAYQYNGTAWTSVGNSNISAYNLTGVWGDGHGGVWITAINGGDGYIFEY